jgi:hypothetical protein
LGGILQKYSKNARFQHEAGRNLTKIIEKCPLLFARIRKNMYLCSKCSVFCIKNNRVLKGTIVSM